MMKESLLNELETIQLFLNRSSDCLQEKDSTFAPKEGMYTVAQHVAHIARTVDWFLDGMFSITGFDMDFEGHIREAMAYDSLQKARNWFNKSIRNAKAIISDKSEDELQAPIAQGPVMGGAPRFAAIGAISEHTAHHRGALTVYSRLLGYVPKMPYGDM